MVGFNWALTICWFCFRGFAWIIFLFFHDNPMSLVSPFPRQGNLVIEYLGHLCKTLHLVSDGARWSDKVASGQSPCVSHLWLVELHPVILLCWCDFSTCAVVKKRQRDWVYHPSVLVLWGDSVGYSLVSLPGVLPAGFQKGLNTYLLPWAELIQM